MSIDLSTYAEEAYTYARITGIPDSSVSASCASIKAIVDKLKNTFEEGGWSVTDIPARFLVRTIKDSGFPMCVLGASNYPFYSVNGAGTGIVVSDDSMDDCCEDESFCECINSGEYTWPTRYISGDETYDDRHSKIASALHIALTISGITAIKGEQFLTSDPSGDSDAVYTPIYITEGGNCVDVSSIGNQLISDFYNIEGGSSTAGKAVGAGFIARSQPYSDDLNATIELYCEYVESGSNSYIRLNYRPDGWDEFTLTQADDPGVFTILNSSCQEVEIEAPVLGSLVGTHPLDQAFDDTVVTMGVSLDGESIDIWVNPHTFIFGPSEAGLSTTGNGFASTLKILRLEQESILTLPNIRELTVVASGNSLSFRERNTLNPINYYCKVSTISGDGEVTFTGGAETPDPLGDGDWGPLLITSFGSSISYDPSSEGIQWVGDIAEISEPWVAFNPFSPSRNTNAPIVGQLWDCIIPHRNLDNSQPNDLLPFFWDGEIWRYYQNNKLNTSAFVSSVGPPSSMAFRVKNLGIFDGNTVDSEVATTILGVTVTPNPVVNGGSITITVAVAPQVEGSYVILYTPNDALMEFDTHILYIGSLESIGTMEVSTINLYVNSTVTLRAKSLNTVDTTVLFVSV